MSRGLYVRDEVKGGGEEGGEGGGGEEGVGEGERQFTKNKMTVYTA